MRVQLSKSAVRLRISIGQAEGLLKSPIIEVFRISAAFSIHVFIQSVMHFDFDLVGDQPSDSQLVVLVREIKEGHELSVFVLESSLHSLIASFPSKSERISEVVQSRDGERFSYSLDIDLKSTRG